MGWAIESSRLKEQLVQKWFKEQRGNWVVRAAPVRRRVVTRGHKGGCTVPEGNGEPPRTSNREGSPAV